MSSVMQFSSSSSQPNRYSSASNLSDERLMVNRKVGILSQTLTPSSQVRWILPARIRSPHQNDVIFVGESCVLLRECLADGRLLEATGKLNIGAQIMAAKVVSAKTEKIPSFDAILDQTYDEDRFWINGKLCEEDQPPQIVVLCTAANELVYLYARDMGPQGARFVYAKRSILHNVTMPSKYGRQMAVDPESKALAVASSTTLTVFSVKHMDEIKAGIDSWNPRHPASFQPSNEQRFFPIDGSIIRMDFLRSPQDEEHKVFLLVIVAKDSQTRIFLYRWDTGQPLVLMEPLSCSGRILPAGDRIPLLLIPAARPISFWLVTESELVYYGNVRSSASKRIGSQLPKDTSGENPLWVQWVKPSRHHDYNREKEDLLLVREDGMTRVFTRHHTPPSDSVICVSPGSLSMCVDTALCALPGPRKRGGDTLIAGGAGTDGGLFWLAPRQPPRLEQVIPNMSPIRDMLTVDHQHSCRSRTGLPGRTFVISGQHSETRVQEFRFGLEAQILTDFAVPDCASIDRIWVVEDVKAGTLYIIASSYEQTLGLAIQLSNAEQVELVHPDKYPGLILDTATIAAAKLSSGPIVQITPGAIHVLTKSPVKGPAQHIHAFEKCVCADIDPVSGVFLVACTSSRGHHIEVGMINVSERDCKIIIAPEVYPIPARPMSVRVVRAEGYHIVALGYFNGCFEIVTIHPQRGIQRQIYEQPTPAGSTGIAAIDVLHRRGSRSALLLAGLLDGRLCVSNIKIGMRDARPYFELTRRYSQVMGSTRVLISPDDSGGSQQLSSFVSGESRLCRISLAHEGADSDYLVDDVWITNRSDMSFKSPTARAVCRISNLESQQTSGLSGSVIFGTNEALSVCLLLEQRQMIPRNLVRCSNARHMQYSTFFDKILVAADGQRGSGTRHSTIPMIYLVDRDGVALPDPREVAVSFGKPGDKIKALLNWSPSDGKTHYNLIVMGISNNGHSQVGHISAKKLANQLGGSATFKIMMSLPRCEIHALCAFGSSSFIISAGNDLLLLHLELAERQWTQQTKYVLPSPGLSVSAHGSLVYVATSKHSMLVLRVENDNFVKVFSDRSAKNARHVVPFGTDGRHALLSAVSGAGTSIYGYLHGSGTNDGAPPWFEVQVPLPIDCLVPIKTAWAHGEHYAFQGSTVDGTVYLFKTLKYEEWKLARFLERLAQPDVSKPARRQLSLLTNKMARTWVSKAETEGLNTFDPTRMHVRGDVLERLIEEGPFALRDLLATRVKSEDDMAVDSENSRHARLEALATPVIGQSSDMVGDVIAWIRCLLRATA